MNQIPRNVAWAVVFFFAAAVVLFAYQMLVVKPLTGSIVAASGGVSDESVSPPLERLTGYLYVVYEGIIELLVFVTP